MDHKTDDQISVIKRIKDLYNGREKVIKFYNFYTGMVSEAKCKSIHGEGLKILTHKQMLQRLPIALAQEKAGNKKTYTMKSENLHNEIRKIIYSLYRVNEVTEKVYNNIMNSMKL